MAYDKLIPTLDKATTEKTVTELQTALDVLNDLALTLKHAHWNVYGPNFIAVHEMLDPQIDELRDAADTVAERIAALGSAAVGTSTETLRGAKAILREYPVKGKDTTEAHLAAIDDQYTDAETYLRGAIVKVDELDLVSSNILQDVLQNLEQFQWFVRSHLA
jgi:starvation-inducible DNA-binding protein